MIFRTPFPLTQITILKKLWPSLPSHPVRYWGTRNQASAQFYEDFIEEMTLTDHELKKNSPSKSGTTNQKRKSIDIPSNNYRKLSLQTEQYSSYFPVHVPVQPFYNPLSPEEKILNHLDQAACWAMDQYDSRAVQAIIQNEEPYAKNAVFQCLFREGIELTKDKFGNYVFQKIFELGSEEQR